MFQFCSSFYEKMHLIDLDVQPRQPANLGQPAYQAAISPAEGAQNQSDPVLSNFSTQMQSAPEQTQSFEATFENS